MGEPKAIMLKAMHRGRSAAGFHVSSYPKLANAETNTRWVLTRGCTLAVTASCCLMSERIQESVIVLSCIFFLRQSYI